MKFTLSFGVFILLSFPALSVNSTEKLVKMNHELNGSCNYAPTQKLKDDKTLSCVVSKLAERCNKIDDCYSYCIATDLNETVGGGCAHICNYSNKIEWSPPQSVKLCTTE